MSDGRQPFMLILTLREDLRDPARWTDAERQAVGAHFEMLQREAAAGNMLLAGRSDEYQADGHMHPDVMGIGIFLANSREEAEKFIAADPAVVAGVMSVRLHKFNLAVHADAATWTALSEQDGSSR
ncbi:YciI family protein [Mesorhizobium sp. ZC-5]|uniref:YciI family protein n=1 Tax=Mesorhizobium sp. ZC-5 TaxID=2986066 RepID=UPI0021E745FC|nr:YciI family protein [Mesorhizobium sp. ZC-5]MCV3243225.1 YciI family protein [Mesorhizobium sp. ZC-5]